MTDPMLMADLAEIVRSNTETPPEVAISPETRFVEDLGADSFSMVCIVFALEETYGIKVEPDFSAIVNLRDLASYVARKRGSKSSAA